MALSPGQPHPVAAQNPTVLRAFAALPAAGAWDADPTVVACAGFWWCRFFFAYQRGVQAGAGSLDYYWQVSPWAAAHPDVATADAEWFDGSAFMAGDMTQCQDIHSAVQNEFITFCSQGAAIETFIGPPIHLAGCVERIRLYCRESPGGGGDIANPGSAYVLGVFYKEG